MSNQIPLIALSLLLWVFLAYRFLRAFVRQKLTNIASLYAWTIFFLCYLVVALDVPSVEAQINAHFDGFPVAALVRSEAILVTAHLFFLGTRHIDQPSIRIKRIFSLANPLIILFSIILFIWLALSRAVSPNELTHIIKTIREGSMLLWTPLVFWPALVQIWRLEKFRPMKLRYILSLMFYAAYILECASGLVWSYTVFFAPALQAQALLVDQITSVVCLIQFVVMLFPFRWLMLVFYPAQLRLYIRLRRLRAAVKNFSTAHPPIYQLPVNLTRSADIELAIYQQVIEILDMYPSMNESGETLRRRIQTLVETEPQYVKLVDELAAIRL